MKYRIQFANITAVMILILFVAAACGTVATPPPSSEELTAMAAEAEAHADEAAHAEEGAQTGEEVVAEEPTETPVPPTETPVPPTATPTEVEPTATPTEEPTAEPASSASNDPLVRLVQLTGNAERGDEIFHATYDTASGPYACATCHSIEPDVRLIGPSQWGVRQHAETRVEGESWAQYIYNSITMPNAYIVEADPPYPENLMPANYAELFSDQDIYNLIAYLATLNDGE